MEPQPEKVGVLLFIGETCSPNGSIRRLSFENPVSNETGFFVFMVVWDQSQNLWSDKKLRINIS